MAESYYWSVLVVVLLAVMIPTLLLALAKRFGPRPGPRRGDRDKLSAYECGIRPTIDARRRFSVKFYLVAVLFVLFDVEVAFLIPWAVTFRELGQDVGWGVLVEMVLFLGLLVVGLVYLVRRGALEWE